MDDDRDDFYQDNEPEETDEGFEDGYDYTNPQTGWYNFVREFF